MRTLLNSEGKVSIDFIVCAAVLLIVVWVGIGQTGNTKSVPELVTGRVEETVRSSPAIGHGPNIIPLTYTLKRLIEQGYLPKSDKDLFQSAYYCKNLEGVQYNISSNSFTYSVDGDVCDNTMQFMISQMEPLTKWLLGMAFMLAIFFTVWKFFINKPTEA